MKRLLKILFGIIGILILVTIVALAYLNFIYLPQKVKSEGPAFLEEKSKGRVQAASVQYIPFRGIKLKNIAVLSKTKKPIFSIEKLYFNVSLWPLLIKRQLDFRIDLYPPGIKRPFVFNGAYRVKEQKLDLDCKIKSNFFAEKQTIIATAKAFVDKEERSGIDLSLTCADLNVRGNFYIEDKDLRIEKFSGKILQSGFDFIGEVQNLSEPSLNIYGNLDLNLADLKDINPEYSKLPEKLNMDGRCLGEILISSKPDNPQIDLKCKASQIGIEKIKVKDLSSIFRMENKEVSLSKFYAKLCDGEINLQGACKLDSPEPTANLNINIFNLDLNKLIRDITGKETPVHGRFFSLGRLAVPLKDPRDVEGKVWLSCAGSNILRFPVFTGIADVLRLPQLRKIEFKEASGNFTAGRRQIETGDFKIASSNMVIYLKGYVNFAGNLAFDIEPSFSPAFLAAPNIGNILGIFVDSSTGNFMGEIKLKGTLKEPRYTFKPFSQEKFFPRAIEKTLKELFKFKKEKE